MDFDPRSFDRLKTTDDMGGNDIQEVDGEFLKKAKVSWFTRTLLSFAVPWGLSRLAKELHGPGIEMSKKAHALFTKTERVEIVPSHDDHRGFQIIIDNMLSLYFVQDGDHFVYDGFELGPCENGDVTIFDKKR